MSRRDETYEVSGKVKRETDSAILVEMDDGEDVWFPLSQVEEIHSDGRIVVSMWIAEQKGLV